MDSAALVAVAVVAVRALVPLAVFRWPLPALLASFVADALDQTVFQAFGDVPADYEAYDKAMDTYYLALAYLAALRNWTSVPAVRIAGFLFFYRLAGVVAYELAGRAILLLVFPNTFEYFFVAYEVVRLRWRPELVRGRWWLLTAAVLWVLVKLPQEWWIHVARLDTTTFVSDHPGWGWSALAALPVAAAATWLVLRRHVPPPDHGWRLVADAPPAEVDETSEQSEWIARHVSLWSWSTLEKVCLVTMLVVVYGQVVPGTDATEPQLFLGSLLVAVGNVAVVLVAARHRWMPRSLWRVVLGRLALNALLVAVVDGLASAFGVVVDPGHALVFLALITVVGTAHDHVVPIRARRDHQARSRADAGW
ncbi:hypothetical protein [Nocardioides sp. YIM 152315]|uniref:hypothetical protein n=1 Tax=Nocardioides sp. YIM 152315 TaxID=3031760 RepID=UPI0023DBC2B3|nr:hypothetical protein [Nocardioides sp. YIM 152315]MDF1605931.1 hypothetical protein [Nocardioides sp. YIM 152315]